MVDAIREAGREHGQPVPQEEGAVLARCILDSLAMLYRRVLLELSALHGIAPARLHIVGGGSQNRWPNQLTADCCQLPVSAGPVEASTLGNVGCQLMALNEVADVAAWRRIVTSSFPLAHYLPSPIPDFAHHWQRFQALYHPQEEILL